jgi:hypothetical protein
LVLPLFVNSSPPPSGAPGRPATGWVQGTVQPGDLLGQLVDGGADLSDLGITGHGSGAVHAYGFTVVGPPLALRNTSRVEKGTISVSVATGLISKMAWTQPVIGGYPDRILTQGATVEYSDYGLTVTVPAP